jgi:hypothetical protein
MMEDKDLRDVFAATALQGLLANDNGLSASYSQNHILIATRAYKLADAMLQARTWGEHETNA